MQVQPWVHVHLSDDMLEEYLFGRVQEPDCSALEEHLLYCFHCQDALETASQFAALMKQEVADFPARVQLRSPWRRWLGWKQPARPSGRPRGVRLSLAAAGAAFAAVLAVALLPWRPQMGPPAAVTLAAFRGSDVDGVAHAPAGRALDLSIDAARLPGASYSLQIVDAGGAEVWRGLVSLQANTHLAARVPKRFGVGVYWVRLYQSSEGQSSQQRSAQDLVREFGLRIE